jgi:AcrR family transcriptional regulator
MSADARRDQLFDAALQLIARDGYAAVSIESIAREADVTRPVVYHVFTDLDDLLTALLDRQERRALDQLLATITAPDDLTDIAGYVQRVIESLVAMVAGDPPTWRPIFLTFAGTPSVVQRRIGRARDMIRVRIEQFIRLALTTRDTPTGIDPAVVAHLLVAVGEYYGRMILEDPIAVDAATLASTVAALLPADRQR